MSSGAHLISIRNLSCSYRQTTGSRVLHIRELDIAAGKVVFLLGPSGSGKSTLLETLGMMNNTIVEGEVSVQFKQGEPVRYGELWKKQDVEGINGIRKHFLSFIFQNTNLMENFTAYENICLSGMIKGDADQQSAMVGAVELMHQVKLPPDQVDLDTLSVNLSGGQRQRVSFARALNTDYRLLLCDEPAGNLDEVNANELMSIVRKNLSGDRTAVLVSHDVRLALKYADQIIVLTRNPVEGYGEILPQHIFSREDWESRPKEELEAFRQKVVSLFAPAPVTESKANRTIDFSATKGKRYADLFKSKEGKVLFGKSRINLWILTSIITLTLIAMGFANGVLGYLDKKLNDPFVNWMLIEIPMTKSSTSSVNEMQAQLLLKSEEGLLSIDTVTAYKQLWFPLFPANGTISEMIQGRTFVPGDPLEKDLLAEKNNPRGKPFLAEDDLGIIVTRPLLKTLGYSPDARFIYLDNLDLNEAVSPPSNFRVPIPVRAVVDEIPGKNEFLVTEFFFLSYTNQFSDNIFDFRLQSKQLNLCTGTDRDFALKLKNEIEQSKGEWESESSLDVSVDPVYYLNDTSWQVTVSWFDMPEDHLVTEELYRKISGLPLYKQNQERIERVFYLDDAPLVEPDMSKDFLSINLGPQGLDQIDSVAKFIFRELNSGNEKDQSNIISVDSTMIKEKKNFNYLSKITYLITVLLVVFSIAAILMFISNLLKSHLEKVKMNLGTFKAFGLSDRESKNIYIHIMLRFILTGLALSIIIAAVAGTLMALVLERIIGLEDNLTYFSLIDPKTVMLIVLIVSATVIVSYYNINKILSKTPGDLIYNR